MAASSLPFEAYLFAVLPVPAWPDFMDPAYGEDSPGVVAPGPEDVSRAVVRHFAFLGPAGFDVVPPDNWERGATVAIPFARDDAAILVVVAETAGLFVVVTPAIEGDVTARTVLQAIVGGRSATSEPALFGSFPLAAGSAQALEEVVARHAGAFDAALGDLLRQRPAEIPRIRAAATKAVAEAGRNAQATYYRARGGEAWVHGCTAAIVESYERLAQVAELRDDEADRLAAARAQLASATPPLARDGASDRQWIERRAEHLRQTGRALDEAWKRRAGSEGHAAWEDAARELRQAVEIMYPPEFWAGVRRLQDGDPGAVEPMLVFLEADPWCFRSGYAKETILHLLRRHDLAHEQGARLEAVLLRAVDVGDRREFRSSCKLASRNTTPGLRQALRQRLHSDDPGVARRALWMLTALRRARLDSSDVAVARAIVLRAASGPDSEYWTVPEWVATLAWRFWSQEWADELLAAALRSGPEADAALRVISDVPRVQLDADQREALALRLLAVVDHGEDESWFEGIAPLVDSPALRDELERRRHHPDDDVRRRGWWALNAILRAEEGRTDP